MSIVVQVISLIGAVLILLAYAGVQRGWWTPERAGYLWANLIGSSLLAVVAISDRRIGFVLLEVVWAAVSLWSLIRAPASPPRPSPG